MIKLEIEAFKLLVIAACTMLKVARAAQLPLDPTLLLNQAPFVFAHNAATGYLQVPTDFSGAAEGYTKNQEGNFTDLLNCGARALDLEFVLNAGQVLFGHGAVLIPDLSIGDGIQEVVDWTRNVAPEELILLSIEACDDCVSAVTTILDSLGIPLISDCSILNGLTVGRALELGPVVAIVKDCFVQNYNESLSCHGFLPSSNEQNVDAVRECIPDLAGIADLDTTTLIPLLLEVFSCLSLTLKPDLVAIYDCWNTSDTNDFPRSQLLNYLNTTAASGPPANGLLWQVQGLWQSGEDSVLLGLFRPLPLPESLLQLLPSSLLKDLEMSEVNRLVLDFVVEQVEKNTPLNLIEVDHVCDEYGSQLLPALRSIGGSTTSSSTVSPNATEAPPPTTPAPTSSPTVEVTSASGGFHLGMEMTWSVFVAVSCASLILWRDSAALFK
jgi:hypothetical protein